MGVEKLEETALPDVLRLITSVVLDMRQKQIDQWDESYPDRTILEADLKAGRAWGLSTPDCRLIGYIVLDEVEADQYRNVSWENSAGKILRVHRCCVDPMFSGKGLGDELIAFAERYAHENGYVSIRLDTSRKNKPFQYMLERNDYQYRGIVNFRKGEFWCYEKVLA